MRKNYVEDYDRNDWWDDSFSLVEFVLILENEKEW